MFVHVHWCVMIYLCFETESGSVEPRHGSLSLLPEKGGRRVQEGTERGTDRTGTRGQLGGVERPLREK